MAKFTPQLGLGRIESCALSAVKGYHILHRRFRYSFEGRNAKLIELTVAVLRQPKF